MWNRQWNRNYVTFACLHALWPSFILFPNISQSRSSVPKKTPSTKWPPTLHSSPNWPSKTGQVNFVGPNRTTAPLRGIGKKKFLKAVDYIKYPKLQVLGSSFVKTGDKMRSRNQNKYTGGKGKKRGPKLSPKLVLRGVSPPVLDLPYLLHLELLSQALTSQALT